MNIYQRINAVMRRVEYLRKDDLVTITRRDGRSFSYTAITHDAVTAAIRGAMVECGIVPVVTVNEWSQDTDRGRTAVEVSVKFVNIDRPDDYYIVKGLGFGDDVGDKGPGKAVSYAVKNVYLKALMLETGESDESRSAQEKRQVAMGEAIRKNAGAIVLIQDGIAAGPGSDEYSVAAEAWFEIPEDEQKAMWVAPSKGGPFTTAERKAIKDSSFREAHFGTTEND